MNGCDSTADPVSRFNAQDLQPGYSADLEMPQDRPRRRQSLLRPNQPAFLFLLFEDAGLPVLSDPLSRKHRPFIAT